MNKIRKMLKKSNILLEVVDARFPKDSRIFNIEKIIKKTGKKMIIVINKSDLVPEDFLYVVKEEFEKDFPVVFVSCKTRKGSRKLREIIKKNVPAEKEKIFVGIFGYPNTGKSSIINLLVGRRKAGVSSTPGFTKGIQIIRLSKRIYLIDSPGIVFPKNEELLSILGAIDPSKVKNPIKVVEYLLNKIQKTSITNAYNINFEDINDLFLKLREKYNIFSENWKDIIARRILYDWIKGKIRGYWL